MGHTHRQCAIFHKLRECKYPFPAGFYPGYFFGTGCNPSGRIIFHCFIPLLESPRQVMETFDDLRKRLLEIGEQALEASYSHSALICEFG